VLSSLLLGEGPEVIDLTSLHHGSYDYWEEESSIMTMSVSSMEIRGSNI